MAIPFSCSPIETDEIQGNHGQGQRNSDYRGDRRCAPIWDVETYRADEQQHEQHPQQDAGRKPVGPGVLPEGPFSPVVSPCAVPEAKSPHVLVVSTPFQQGRILHDRGGIGSVL
ncbi:MAG: hypothetical protein QGI75_01675 [Phycisphaerales bacterium]|nr:hypothetical protein [Phycisphaerales bacterium]